MNLFRWSLVLFLFCLMFKSMLAAQDVWNTVTMSDNGRPLPLLRAIGVPATATYDGKKLKAYVFIWGCEKNTGGTGYPDMAIYVEGMEDLIPDKELAQFDGDLSDDFVKLKTLEVAIIRKGGVLTVSNKVCLDGTPFPPMVPDGNEVFDTGVVLTFAEKSAWKKFIAEMSNGFEKGHLSIGGHVLSKKIEVDFIGNGIGPLLQRLTQFVEP